MISENFNSVIRNRKSIYPSQYNGQEIPIKLIKELLENANTAPTHKLTQPWLFKVFAGEKKTLLLNEIYKINKDKISDKKIKSLKEKFNNTSHIICVCMQRSDEKLIPEWEEIAATSMAVQNIWLTCTANKIGCYWSTPKYSNKLNSFLKLEKNQKCLGFIYTGLYDNLPNIKTPRLDINSKTTWNL
jgi:nitroreductase